MSTLAAPPHENRAPSFWASTVGKKIVMAVTGAILFGFVIVHLLGNLQVYRRPGKAECLWRLSSQHRRNPLARAHHPSDLCHAAHHRDRATGPAEEARAPDRIFAQAGHRLLLRLQDHVLVGPDRARVHHFSPASPDRRLHPSRRSLHRRRRLPQRGLRFPGVVGFPLIHRRHQPLRAAPAPRSVEHVSKRRHPPATTHGNAQVRRR